MMAVKIQAIRQASCHPHSIEVKYYSKLHRPDMMHWHVIHRLTNSVEEVEELIARVKLGIHPELKLTKIGES